MRNGDRRAAEGQWHRATDYRMYANVDFKGRDIIEDNNHSAAADVLSVLDVRIEGRNVVIPCLRVDGQRCHRQASEHAGECRGGLLQALLWRHLRQERPRRKLSQAPLAPSGETLHESTAKRYSMAPSELPNLQECISSPRGFLSHHSSWRWSA